MQVHLNKLAIKRNLNILKRVYRYNFNSKINLNHKNKQDNGCAFENKHIHMLYKYIKYIYVKENVYNCKD